MKKHLPLFLGILYLILPSCNQEEGCQLNAEIVDAQEPLKVVRLEQSFFQASTSSDFMALMEQYPEFTSAYLQPNAYLSVDSLLQDLVEIHQDSSMRVLNDSVQVVFPDLSTLEEDLGLAFASLKHHFPDFKIPKVYSFVSGFTTDLLVSESIIIIGLDFFLPVDHPFQPELPRYLADRYGPDYLVPMIVTAISSRYNQTDPQNTSLLAEMIYYGKAYHFTKSILPCTTDQYIIGYSPQQLADSFANEEYIWSHFVENELLYETNPFIIRKYIGEAPFTDAISTAAPGRIGRWLGWNIVDDFRSNQKVSLAELMNNANAEALFRSSGYRPLSAD